MISEKTFCTLISSQKNPTKVISSQCSELCLAPYVQFVIQNISQTNLDSTFPCYVTRGK